MTWHVRHNGTWEEIIFPSVRHNGVWEEILEGHVRHNGVWEEFFTSFTVTWAGDTFVGFALSPNDATATVSFANDGSIGGSGTGGWGTPVGGSPGDRYEIRLDVVSDSAPTSGPATGTYHSLSSTRTWTLVNTTAGTVNGTWRIRIRRAADSVVVADANATVEATVAS